MKIEAARLVSTVREILSHDAPEAEVLAVGLLEEMNQLLARRRVEVVEDENLDEETREDTMNSIDMTIGMLERLVSEINERGEPGV